MGVLLVEVALMCWSHFQTRHVAGYPWGRKLWTGDSGRNLSSTLIDKQRGFRVMVT